MGVSSHRIPPPSNIAIMCCLCEKEPGNQNIVLGVCKVCIGQIVDDPKPWKRLKNKLDKLEKI